MPEYQGAGLRHDRLQGLGWRAIPQEAYTDPAYIADGPKAYVCNVSDQEFVRGLGSLGMYTIPAARTGHIVSMSSEGLKLTPCEAGDEYALLEIEPRIEKVDIGMGLETPPKWGREHWPARKIAESVALAHSTENLEKFGVFVCESPRPARHELDRAHAALTAYYQKLVFEADQLHARPQGFRDITDVHRRAARFLRQERPWCYTPSQMQACPGCGAGIAPGIAKHPACGAILDRHKASELGMLDQAEQVTGNREQKGEQKSQPAAAPGKKVN